MDTSSLLALVRYYLPFDNDGVLYDYVKGKFESRKMILVDKVYDECAYTAKGIVLKTLSFLKDKDFRKSADLPLKTDSLTPPSPKKFFLMVENNFVIKSQKDHLSPTEFEHRKNEFMESADIKQVLLCLNGLEEHSKSDMAIITEETVHANDNKLFAKIPAICLQLEIRTMTLPALLSGNSDIDMSITRA